MGRITVQKNDRYGTILLVVFTCQTHTCSTCTLVFILPPTLDKAQRMSAWEASLYCHLIPSGYLGGYKIRQGIFLGLHFGSGDFWEVLIYCPIHTSPGVPVDVY